MGAAYFMLFHSIEHFPGKMSGAKEPQPPNQCQEGNKPWQASHLPGVVRHPLAQRCLPHLKVPSGQQKDLGTTRKADIGSRLATYATIKALWGLKCSFTCLSLTCPSDFMTFHASSVTQHTTVRFLILWNTCFLLVLSMFSSINRSHSDLSSQAWH